MILLLDTSTPICHLTLVRDGEQFDYEWQADRTLARDLLKFLRDKLSEHSLSIQDVSGLGVMKGPGSFTGLRIGITVLNTLADSLELPIVGVEGDDWRGAALDRLQSGHDDKIVLPKYGSDANITTPRK